MRSTAVAVALALSAGVVLGQQAPLPLCRLVLHEEQTELEDARLEVDVARSTFAAFEEIFALIERLWEEDATERMVYLEAKYDRDAARLALERADLILERQSALLEQYRLVCEGSAAEAQRSRAVEQAHRRYLRADCAALDKARAIAETKLVFDREWLASILELRASDVGTRPDVIRAELEVEREQKRLEDAKRRAAACRERLPRGTREPADAEPPR